MRTKNKQQGMVLPIMLFFLVIMTLIAGRIYALSQQQRAGTGMLVQRSRDYVLMLSVEDFVLRKLPGIDIAWYQRSQGKEEGDPMTVSLSLPEGEMSVQIDSAQQCVNVAPLESGEQKDNPITRLMLSRLLSEYDQPAMLIDALATMTRMNVNFPDGVEKLICYIPGAGQQWDYHYLKRESLLLALMHEDASKGLLRGKLTKEQAEDINTRFKRPLLVGESQYYWLNIRFDSSSASPESPASFYVRDLVSVNGTKAQIILRRLIEDDAL